MAISADALAAAVTKFSDDFSKFSTDLTAFLGRIPVDDPTTQNKIDTAVAALTDFDSKIQALDAAVNPPVVVPPPTEQP